ncbi:hypothetical protein [Microbispora sp. ATCC PTA-5024]|uniref:hypothetical protein n=1 Tax=Microbispora sp. ATCC PTA-5024 TaxID=316330 RepID=UPI0012EDB076|nr:hypothetical protein [Microbispora sp. ATCC PTA-5024]
MSEVVPLPSFGEVFFDARGQDRVLRVTWHDGTLVLSLWRGEMCTASFRMPMSDVGRLIDTLDEGFHEAGGHLQDEDAGTGPFPAPEGVYQAREGHDGYAAQDDYPAAQAPEEYATQVHDPYAQEREGYARPAHADYQDYPDYPDYPGTGQYARPPVPAPAPSMESYPQEPYAEPYPSAAATLGPNDVLVARGAPAQDRLVASSAAQQVPQHAQYGPMDGQGVPQAGPRSAPQPGRPMAPPQQAPQGQWAPQHPPAGGAEVDPSDPLGLGQVRPYVQEPMYSTGERLRPEPRREHRVEPPVDQPVEQWADHRAETWEDARGW